MPDYCSSGLWSATTGMMFDCDELKLSDSTIFYIEAWCDRFEYSDLYNDPEERKFDFDIERCNSEGIIITEMLMKDNPLISATYLPW
jgi:hypothetical protein